MIYEFSNGIKVIKEHLIPIQLDRYRIDNRHEPIEEDWFCTILGRIRRSNANFYDIGAGIGYYIILAKSLKSDLEITAFEPLEVHRQYIVENLKINGLNPADIVIESSAVSDRDGQAILKVQHYGSSLVCDNSSSKSTSESMDSQRSGEEKFQPVETITLDNFLEDTGEMVNLIKLDVQGHELEVLRGAKRSIQRGVIQHWIIGTHGDEIHHDCVDFLETEGYRILFDNPEVEIQPDGIIVAELPKAGE